jgi:hypothetical protein
MEGKREYRPAQPLSQRVSFGFVQLTCGRMVRGRHVTGIRPQEDGNKVQRSPAASANFDQIYTSIKCHDHNI